MHGRVFELDGHPLVVGELAEDWGGVCHLVAVFEAVDH